MAEVDVGPFVPDVVAREVAGVGPTPVPASRSLRGVVVMVDISGFTELTARLADEGPGGAETLAQVLNASFGGVVDELVRRGGDVVGFIGDAVQALWPLDDDDPATTAARAVTAALAAQRSLTGAPPTAGVTVQARVGIDVGPVWVSVVGGHGDEWRWLVHGPPLGGAGRAAARAQRGQVVVSAAVADAAGLTGGPAVGDDGHRVVLHPPPLVDESPIVAAEAEAEAAVGGTVVGGGDAREAFLPREVAARVRAGPREWLAEFRHLTALFVGVDGFDPGAPGALDGLQGAIERVQAVVARFDGSLGRVFEDEKALTILAGWGLPEHTHEDDALRAALAGRAVVDELVAAGFRARAGLATGRCFTGIVGSAARAEYTMLGDTMNLAARLMGSSADEVRGDEPTARAAGGRLDLTALGALPLKGKAGGTEAWRIEGAAPEAGAEAPTPSGRRRTLVGRAGELDRLAERVGRLVATGRGGGIVIEGAPGIGKSELVAALLASSDEVRFHVGEADAIERSTGYYPWRRPLLGLLDVEGGGPADTGRAVQAALADTPELADLAPLLEAVVPVGLDASPAIDAMDTGVRAEALRRLVVALASRAARSIPRVVVLDDAHWMDSSSWALALEVARRAPGVLVVLTLRPMGDDAPVELERLLAEPDVTHLALDPLTASDTDAVVAHRLGVASVPPEVATFVGERAEGNPFFSEQLALALRDAGHLLVADGSARLAPDVDLDDLDLPDTVRGVLAGRIDRLSESEQLTLKVASVVGRVFAHRVVEAVHPLPDERPALAGHLDRANRLDLTRLAAPRPDLSYLFTHVITQEVTYDLLVFAQRRSLHRAVAEWYEGHVEDLAPHVTLLAHHWRRAEDTERALHYLGRAGATALANHANDEALGLLTEALELDEAHGRPTPPEVRAAWERGRGIALTKTGRYREAQAPFEASLALLGAPNPAGAAGRALSIGGDLARQGWRRARPVRPGPAGRDRALALSECHRYLCEVAYWQNDLPRLAHSAFASLDHAEPAGDTEELVVASATVGFLLGMARLHGQARRYFVQADAVGERVGNPDASGYAAELAAVYALFAADWPAVREAAQRGAETFAGVGDRMRWHTCFSLVGYAHLHQGYFDDARPYWREGLDALGPEGHLQGRLWSLAGLLATDLAQDRLDAAVADELRGLLGPEVHHSDEVLVRGLLAARFRRDGDRPAAVDQARRVVPMAEAFPPPSWHALTGLVAAAEVLVEDGAGAATPEARAWARRGLRALRRFGRFNPAARPHLARLEGVAAQGSGRAATARRAWHRSRRRAEALDMPHAAALVALDQAGAAPEGTEARRSAALTAHAALTALGASHDATRAEALLP